MRILLATENPGKVAELRRAFAGSEIELVTYAGRWPSPDIEVGESFAENALIKARFAYGDTGEPVIADDSGLEVQALDGAPGVRSARFAGESATDHERIVRLLRELERVPAENRQARFVSAAAVVWAAGENVFEGSVEGTILREPRGQGGFGYDPIFYYPPLSKTFAEMTPEEKWQVSHRGKAFRRLAAWIFEAGGLVDTKGSSAKIIHPAK